MHDIVVNPSAIVIKHVLTTDSAPVDCSYFGCSTEFGQRRKAVYMVSAYIKHVDNGEPSVRMFRWAVCHDCLRTVVLGQCVPQYLGAGRTSP